ncbi:helix-turn-helix domain-containing protein [Aureisphaera galaxeae]|uniref:helix-turn-helix domain-containing protein n=1 Tax=Aureisphaera galaxeae TaxID=1538023 RepID=UPI00234FEBFD|nr:helix-turn-helix domain-containing protein [Aureisphaera galaxeae]MDC8003952.1 helix-turn-helix domain-containing protein [Aureisphaera galaxeae]
MNIEKFTPEINKVYFIDSYSLIHILSGKGSIQVDFKNYSDWQEKAIFLEKGQYIKFLSDDFEVRKIVFSDETKFYNKEVRVLFKHLISLGYIDLMECEECQNFLSETVLFEGAADIIDISSKQWYWQNPFNANKEEYQIIFDTKDIIDQEFANNLTSLDLVGLINDRGYGAQTLIKDKIGITVKNLMGAKRLMESKKEIAFTDKSIQEVSYDMGYNDPSYFNRTFKNATGQTPKEFRENFDFENRDLFAQTVLELLKEHHQEERALAFYAEKMNVSVKTLSKKVKAKMNTTMGQLIRSELLYSAMQLLQEGERITSVSERLSFEEPNHFSSFFKHYLGITPSEFLSKKYHK